MDTSRLIDDINNGNFNEKLLDIYIDKERILRQRRVLGVCIIQQKNTIILRKRILA